MPRFCDTCSAAMNCPWFLKPAEASFSDMRVPSAPSGNIPLIFALSFGFDEIFAATGFIGVVCVDDPLVLVVVGVPFFFGAAVVEVVDVFVDFFVDVPFDELLVELFVCVFVTVVPVVDTVVDLDLLADLAPVDFDLLAVWVDWPAAGLPPFVVRSVVGLVVVGLPATVVGFGADECPRSAYAGVSVRHAAAVKPRMVRVSRIRLPPGHLDRKRCTEGSGHFWPKIGPFASIA